MHSFKNESGIALLIVLWVMVILMVIVFSFSLLARTETYSALAFKEGVEKKFLAEAGIERGIMELFYRQRNLNVEGSEVWKTDGTTYSETLGVGSYRVRITDESGKVDLNTAPEAILRSLLTSLGIEEELRDTIVDSIMDWKDPDDLHRLNGAESDYYMSLPHPYKAKNANFEAVEELLLVKGVTPVILYGDGSKQGLIDLLTIHGRSNKINVNAASKGTLMGIPGMTTEMADAIISYREANEIKNIQELATIIGDQLGTISPFISTGGTNTYTLESLGIKNTIKGGYGIKAVVTLLTANKYITVYYKCPVTIK